MKSLLSLLLVSTVAAAVAVATFHLQAAQPSPQTPVVTPPSLDDGWTTGSLEQAGIDRARIESMTRSIRTHPEYNLHALLIESGGRLVYEEYFSGKDERWGTPLGDVTFTRETKHDLRSVTKSVVSALLGIANRAGAIPSLDAPLLDSLPSRASEIAGLSTVAPDREEASLRQAYGLRGPNPHVSA